jgi:hypothetical protein
MANPNRCMAYVGKNPSAYDCFPTPAMAGQFERAAQAAGFKTRSTRFRVGPRNANRWSYRVSVYWKAGEAAPDMSAFRNAVGR